MEQPFDPGVATVGNQPRRGQGQLDAAEQHVQGGRQPGAFTRAAYMLVRERTAAAERLLIKA